MRRSVIVIGIGNRLRGDDATGATVVHQLADLERHQGIDVAIHAGDGAGLIDRWDGADAVVLVDSVRSGAPVGTIVRVDASSTPVQVPLGGTSSHALGVAGAIELARALGRLPRTTVVYGIEGAAYEAGSRLSDGVGRAVEAAAEAVRREALALVAQEAPSAIAACAAATRAIGSRNGEQLT